MYPVCRGKSIDRILRSWFRKHLMFCDKIKRYQCWTCIVKFYLANKAPGKAPWINFLCSLLLFSVVVCGCKKAKPDYEQRNSYYKNIASTPAFDSALTVVTYNIQCGFEAGKDPWNKAHEGGTAEYIGRLAAVIEQSGADVVMLQEVPHNRSNTDIKEFLAALGEATDMNYSFGAHGYNDAYGVEPVRGQWGNAILSKYEISEIENIEVARTDVWRRRSVLRSRLKLGEGKFIDCYSLHHLSYAERQQENTVAFVKSSSLPKVVGGDFNTAPNSFAGYSGLAVIQKDSIKGIDHILISDQFTAINYGIVPLSRLSEATIAPSDHEAVFAQIQLH